MLFDAINNKSKKQLNHFNSILFPTRIEYDKIRIKCDTLKHLLHLNSYYIIFFAAD